MFDKSIRNYMSASITNTSPSRIDVHEHRAATDESLRLCIELQEKILNGIIFHESVKQENSFNYNIDIINLAVQNMTSPLHTKLVILSATVNGKNYVVKKYLNELGISEQEILLESIKNKRKITIEDIAESRLLMLSELIAKVLIDNDQNRNLINTLYAYT